MINKNELRIGNIIEWNDDKGRDCFYRVARLDEDNLGADCISEEFAWFPDRWTILYNDAIPIPLTPEILEKIGITQISIGGRKYFIDRWGDGTVSIYDRHIDLSDIPCKYLHQLQNLIFALTGEELEVTVIL